ncbi:SMa0974 family conjugal transfer regulator [Ensifer aridi]|uniref:SMa0974 family conjugal transfer regulator n=1 Tax=Ensifer aridi TaxID=1708715 RepID=UPI0007C7D12C|nr:hypothetical protein [Ensifer aridi]
MYEHLSECCVLLQNSTGVVHDVSLRIAELSVSTADNGMEKTFLFVDGEATVRAVDRGVLMRVVATDVISYYGIRTALEGSIFEAAALAREGFAWRPAGRSNAVCSQRTCSSDQEFMKGEELAPEQGVTGQDRRGQPS